MLYALRPSEVPAFRQRREREAEKGKGEKEASSGERQEAEDKLKKIAELKRHRRGIEAAATETLSAEETRAQLRDVATAFFVQTNDLLLTALAEAFAEWTGGDPLLLDREGHGREANEDLDLSRTVGWFTSLFPVLLDPVPELPAEERLQQIREQLQAVPRSGIGYGVLRYCGSPKVAARLAVPSVAEVSFNYLGRLDQALAAGPPFRIARGSSGPPSGRGGRSSHAL